MSVLTPGLCLIIKNRLIQLVECMNCNETMDCMQVPSNQLKLFVVYRDAHV